MNDGRGCGGREKRQRSNSGAGKGVQAVLTVDPKRAGLIIRPPPEAAGAWSLLGADLAEFVHFFGSRKAAP